MTDTEHDMKLLREDRDWYQKAFWKNGEDLSAAIDARDALARRVRELEAALANACALIASAEKEAATKEWRLVAFALLGGPLVDSLTQLDVERGREQLRATLGGQAADSGSEEAA